MHTAIFTQLGDDLPADFETRAQTRLRTSLRRWARRIRGVRVSFRDENGPRGGEDKQCLLVVDTRGTREPLVATGRGLDADRALAKALQRARVRLGRAASAHRNRRGARLHKGMGAA